MKESEQFHLTETDIQRYQQRIAKIDLVKIPEVLKQIPPKVEALVKNPDLADYHIRLISDISKLYTLLKNYPEISDDIKRRILFALEYFLDEKDDIPDKIPGIGLLDDYVLVRWVVDQIMVEYKEVFQA
ncbi:MAG: YkvA family protein [Fidelibacterota bacterium]